MPELLLGSGHSKTKQVVPDKSSPFFTNLTTCDFVEETKPDVLHDLNVLPWPFESDFFDEVHAYNVLEHLGRQGDFLSFFAHFSEIYRILKPGSFLCAITVPHNSKWLWGDPGHTRAIQPESLVFLDQNEYAKQLGKTAMSDYTFCYKADFQTIQILTGDEAFGFILKAIKPSRWKK